MLPETANIKWLAYCPNTEQKEGLCYCWPDSLNRQSSVRDTELLHLCWLIEETLNNSQYSAFYCSLNGRHISSSWQQRTIALAKIKGIELKG